MGSTQTERKSNFSRRSDSALGLRTDRIVDKHTIIWNKLHTLEIIRIQLLFQIYVLTTSIGENNKYRKC